MSERVAKALVTYIRDLPGKSKFLLIEGSSIGLARAIVKEWREDLPPLLVGGDPLHAFVDLLAFVTEVGAHLSDQRSGDPTSRGSPKAVRPSEVRTASVVRHPCRRNRPSSWIGAQPAEGHVDVKGATGQRDS